MNIAGKGEGIEATGPMPLDGINSLLNGALASMIQKLDDGKRLMEAWNRCSHYIPYISGKKSLRLNMDDSEGNVASSLAFAVRASIDTQQLWKIVDPDLKRDLQTILGYEFIPVDDLVGTVKDELSVKEIGDKEIEYVGDLLNIATFLDYPLATISLCKNILETKNAANTTLRQES